MRLKPRWLRILAPPNSLISPTCQKDFRDLIPACMPLNTRPKRTYYP